MIAVLMFDHCQLGTVSGLELYKSIHKTKRSEYPLSPIETRGRRIYRDIDKVIYLKESMRFTEDSEWGEWLAQARMDTWADSLRTHIATLPDFDGSESSTNPTFIQTVSTDNATRVGINDTAIRRAIRKFGWERKVYVISASTAKQISPFNMATLRGLPDNKTGGVPVFLRAYIGMPVRIKANQCVPKGVVNGASGVIYHIDWPQNTTFTLQPDSTWLPSNLPCNIYVDIARCAVPVRFPGLPHWPHTVMPIYQVTAQISVKNLSHSIKGFPIVPAFAATNYGVQGETRDRLAITNVHPTNSQKVDPHALYVALLRLRTRHGLHWIGSRPTAADYDFFKPNQEVLAEDARLNQLSDHTIDSFQHLANDRTIER